jgi:hypothetical protein
MPTIEWLRQAVRKYVKEQRRPGLQEEWLEVLNTAKMGPLQL